MDQTTWVAAAIGAAVGALPTIVKSVITLWDRYAAGKDSDRAARREDRADMYSRMERTLDDAVKELKEARCDKENQAEEHEKSIRAYIAREGDCLRRLERVKTQVKWLFYYVHKSGSVDLPDWLVQDVKADTMPTPADPIPTVTEDTPK